MKINIPRLKYTESTGNWVWNLNGRECKLQINRTTFKPTSKVLGFNQAEAHKQAEILNDKFYQFKNGITSKEYTFGWCIQKFMQSNKWTGKIKRGTPISDNAKKDYKDTFKWLSKIKSNNGINFLDVDSREFNNEKHLDNLVSILIKGRNGDRTDAYTSAKQVVGHLRAVMMYFTDNKDIYKEATNPFLNPKIQNSGQQTYWATEKDLEIAVEQADQMDLRPIGTALMLAYYTTIRVGYIRNLQWSKYKKNYIQVFQEKNDAEVDFYLYQQNGQYLFKDLAIRLEEDFKNKQGLFIVMRKQLKNSHGYIRGQYYQYTERFISDVVSKVLNACKDNLSNPNLAFSSFRKGGIDETAVAVGSEKARVLTGHKETKTIDRHYKIQKTNRNEFEKVSKLRLGIK
jgi:hypothetical protein